MIQVTDKYSIKVMPDCYAVAVRTSNGEKGPNYDYRYFYADLEGALKKISRLIEKDGLPQFSPLISSIERVERVHLEMQEYIKEACRNYAYRDDN